MHILGQRFLGIQILLLLAMLIIVKRSATGSVLGDRPRGNFWIWLIHIFNLSFLMIVNPLAAILLLTGKYEAFDLSHTALEVRWVLLGAESAGQVFLSVGFLLMGLALISMGGNYQTGGNYPRSTDRMVESGPYRLIRHPMYSAALCISLGLACLLQSLALLFIFCIYLVLITLLIPAEEKGLRSVYGERYCTYQKRTKRLIPFIITI